MADNPFIPDADAMALMKGLPLATPEQKPRILDTLELYKTQVQQREQEQELQFKRTFMDPVGFGLEPDKKTLLDTTLAKSPDPRGDSFRLMNEQFLASRYKQPVENVSRNYAAMRDVYAKDVFGIDVASDEAFFNRVGEDYRLDDELSQKAIQAAAKDLPPLAAWAESAASVNKSEAWNKSDSSVHLDKFSRVFAGVSEQLAPFRDDVAEMEKRLKLAQSAEVRPEALEAEFGAVRPDQMKGQTAMKEAIDILLDVPADKRPLVMMALASKSQAEGESLDAVQRLGRFFERGVEGLIVEGSTGIANMATDAGVALIDSILGGTGQEMQIPVEGEQAAAPSRQEEYEQLRIQLREISQGLTPLADVKLLGMNLGGAAQSLPMTVAALVPYAGQALVIGQFRQEGIAQTMQENPGMARKDAEAIANISAPIQAAAEIFTSKLLFGKLPAFERFISSPLLTSGGLAARFGTRVAVGTGTEMLEESVQKATPLIIQEAAAALSEDVPGVDWSARMTEFKNMQLDVFTTALPLVLIGAGVGSMGDYSNGVLLAKDKDALVMSGYSREAALEIQAKVKSGDLRGAETQMRQAADTATPEERKIAAEAFRMRSEMQSQAVAAMEANGQIASVRPIAGGKWQVINPDNSAPIEFDNFDSANAARWADAKAKDLRVHAAYRDIISQADRALKEGQENAFIFSPEKMTPEAAVEAGLVSAQAVEGRKKQLAALDEGKLEDQDFTRAEKEAQAEGDTDAVYTILGMNNIENREGVSRGVIRLFQGANFTDLIEEIAEVGFKRHFSSKEANRPAMLASLRQAEGAIQRAEQAAGMEPTLLFRTKDDAQISDSDLIEAFSHLAKSYYINAVEQGGTSADWRTKNKSVPRYLRTLRAALANTEIFKWVKAMGEKLGTIYKRAAMVQEAQKAGGLDAGLEQLIRRSVGLDTQDQMESGILQEAQGMAEEAGFSMASMSLSKGDQSLEQRLAAMFDPFQKNPEQRRKLGLIAKERVAKVAREYLEETAKPGMIKRKLDEMEADRQKKLAKVTDKTPDWVKAQLEKPVTEAQAKAEISQDRLLGWLRALNAAASVLPVEIRGKLLAGGSLKIAALKTNEARLRAIETLIERADTMLEKWLRKEFTTSIEKLFDRYRPTREAGQKPKGKLAPDEQILMDAAEAAMALDPVALQAEIAKAEAMASNPDATDEQQVEAERLRDLLQLTGDWKNADAERMSAAYDAVRNVAEKGWAKWKLAELMKRAERQEMRDSLVQDTGKTGVRGERVAMRKQGETIAGKSLKVLLNLSSFQEIMNFAFGKDSKISKYFQDKERAADNQREDAMQDLDDRVSQFFTTQAGGILKGEQLRFNMGQRTIYTTEEAGEFSQLEAITAILMWQQEDGKRHMMGRMDESGKPSGKWHYDQAFVDTLNAGLDENGRALLSFLRNEYDAEYDSLNALYKERHGVSLPKHQFYSPIVVAPQQAKAGEMVDPLTGSSTTSSILTPGFLRSRSFNAVAEPNFRDALQVFIAHKKMLAHWAAYYDLAVEMQSILNNREVQNAITAKAGEQASLALRRYLDVFAQGGIRDAAAGLETVELQKRIIGRASQVALFGRLSVLLVQSTQLAAASVKMPTGAYLVRLSKLMSGNLAWGDAMNSPYIQRRMKVMTPLLRQAMADLATIGKPNQIKHAAQKVGQLINGADGLFTAGTYAILLDWHKAQARKLGMTDEAEINAFANQNAERDTETVAQPTRSSTRSLAELTATHPLTRAIYSFVSEPRQKLAMLAWAAYQGANRTGAKSTAGKALSLATDPYAAKVAFLTFIVGGLGVQVIKNLWRDAKGDDDEKKWSVQRMTLAMLSSPLSSVPGFAAFTDTGGNLFSSGARLVPALEDLVTEDQDAIQIMQDVDTVLSVAGLFSDNAAAMSAMTHIAVDAAKVLKNLQDEED